MRFLELELELELVEVEVTARTVFVLMMTMFMFVSKSVIQFFNTEGSLRINSYDNTRVLTLPKTVKSDDMTVTHNKATSRREVCSTVSF